jgi:hypothetical protein
MFRAMLAMFLSAALCFSAPETVVKLSAPFSFPAGVGISGNHLFQNNVLFSCNSQINGKKTVELSWSLPAEAENGSISIFSMTGCKVKTFSISSHVGKVEWNIAGSKKIGKGVYFASISYGPSKKNLKLVIN